MATVSNNPLEDSVHVLQAHGAQLEDLSDGELLEIYRSGITDAYSVLYSRYEQIALRVARRKTSDPHLATDAVQEAFTAILSAIQSGAGPVATFTPYLFASIARQVIRQRHHHHQEISVSELPEQCGPHLDLADYLPDPGLRAALQSLPLRWQAALWYLDINDLPPREVAPLFGISPNALVALHRRAKAGLRQEFLRYQKP